MRRRQFAFGSLGLAALGALPRLARAQDTPPADVLPAPGDLITPILLDTKAPALGGAVVTARGVTWLDVGGRRRANAPDAVQKGDLWHLGSNTKAMTAALYAKLVEQGKAKWGATVPELFPDLRVNPAWATTTIEQLMSHHAGVSDKGLIDVAWLGAARTDPRPLPVQRRTLAATAFRKAPAGKPGSYEYANANFIIAGSAIEQITGGPWEDAITEGLFRPLGMDSAGFGPPQGDEPWGHFRDGTPLDPTTLPDNPAALGPAGTVHCSLEHYARFVQLFITEGSGFLTPESITHLTTPGGPEEPGYALGWGVIANRAWAQGPVLAHEGSNTFWHVVALVAPKRGIALIAASNDETRGARAAQTLAFRLREKFAPG